MCRYILRQSFAAIFRIASQQILKIRTLSYIYALSYLLCFKNALWLVVSVVMAERHDFQDVEDEDDKDWYSLLKLSSFEPLM